jgi:hypothetical protein
VVAGVAVLAGVIFGVPRLIAGMSRKLRQRLEPFDYVVFEALPSHLPDMEADLAAQGWRLAHSEAGQAASMLYRFDKRDSLSTPLSEVFDFEKSMPRTANRRDDPDFPIKIKAHGMRKDLVGALR